MKFVLKLLKINPGFITTLFSIQTGRIKSQIGFFYDKIWHHFLMN